MINPRKKKSPPGSVDDKKEIQLTSYLKIPIVQIIEWLKISSWCRNVKAGEAFCPEVRKQHEKKDNFSVFCLDIAH